MHNNIDLHIHTNLSDGSLSPIEIIDLAQKNKINIISITDHDTCDAYTNNLYEYAKNKNIKIITGVEISTKFKGYGIHILGYNFDINNKELKNKLSTLKNARHKYLKDVSIKLNSLGYKINTLKLDKIKSVTKAHIALDIINNPLNKRLLLETFKHIPQKGEFIETIMNENCIAYVKKETITPLDAANLIKNAGGIVILAHPVAYTYENNFSENDILSIIKEINADGIESNYIYIDKNNNKINDINKWSNFANKYKLIQTIGSDFHNIDNIHPEIGLKNEKINTNNKLKKILS